MYRSSSHKLAAWSILTLAGWVSACGEEAVSEPSEPVRATVQPEVVAAFETTGEVRVIVNFHDPEPGKALGDREAHRQALRAVREAVLATSQGGLVPVRQFDHVPAVAGRLSRASLDRLARDPRVSFIQIDGAGQGALTVAVPAIGGDVAKRDYQVTGKGVRVAVLDTGANSNHPDLESSISTTQHCFTQGDCPPNRTTEGTSAEDDHGHGSHVSGIIASDGKVAGVGFAPDAEIVPVKINDQNDSGYVSDWVAGLDWVYENLSTLGVKLINMSICTNALYGSASECDSSEPALATAVKNLVNAGVTVFAASGNRGSSTQMSAPACNTGAIAVGATYKSNQGRQPPSGTYSSLWGSSFGNCADATTAFDQITCFTNSGPRLDLVAPGAIIVSSVLGSQTDSYRGTSQASPAAVGVAALMLQCNPKLAPAQVKDILARTGVSATDAKNGRSYPSIRAAAAVKEACSGSGGAGTGGSSGTGGTSTGGVATGGQATGGVSTATGGRPGGGLTGSGGATLAMGGQAGSAGAGGTTPGEEACNCRTAGTRDGSRTTGLAGGALLLGLVFSRRTRGRVHQSPRSRTKEG